MEMKKERNIIERENGQVLAEFTVMLLVIMLIVAMAVDLGVTNANKARLAQVAQQAEAECAQPAAALLVKNSATPGADMTRMLVKALRADGYKGAVTAYYYEPYGAEWAVYGLGESKRVYIYGVTLEDEAKTIFSVGAGENGIPISARLWQYSVAYSSEKTWRPDMPDNGYIKVAAGQDPDGVALTPVPSLDDALMPGGKEVLTAAIEEAKTK